MPKEILLLIPTQFESEKLRSQMPVSENVTIAVCGFGPVAAAARTATLLSSHQPEHVILIGIAGSIGNRMAVGDASSFSGVAIDGIGAGSGSNHLSAKGMGWNFLDIDGESIGDYLSLIGSNDAGQLLTVCAASGSAAEANCRAETFPEVVAEDMEAFGVAFACRLAGVPLTVVRGISNVAGDRDKTNWKIDAALQSAATLANEKIKELL